MTVKIDVAKLEQLIANTGGAAERIVADGVTYGIYQELGTSKMPAHPFMSPAVEEARPGFVKHAGQVALLKATPDDVVELAARNVERGAKERAPVDTGALRNSIHVSKP